MTTLLFFTVHELSDGTFDYKAYEIDLAGRKPTTLLEQLTLTHAFLAEASINLLKMDPRYRNNDDIKFRTFWKELQG